jgi:ligand-binding sensor domain-containing protein
LLSVFSCKKDIIEDDRIGNKKISHKILDNYTVHDIVFDSKGNAWVATFNQGIIKYNPGSTVVFDSTNSVLSSHTWIFDVAIDSKDNIWIGTNNGLIKCDGKNFTVISVNNAPIPKDNIIAVAVDSKDNIWFSSFLGRDGGLVKYDGSTFAVYTKTNSVLRDDLISSIAIDKDDNVWFAQTEYYFQTFLMKISSGGWNVYNCNDLNFSPYVLGNIELNSKNQPYILADYKWSEPETGPRPQLFSFDGSKLDQFQFDDKSTPWDIMIDNEDNLWCCGLHGFIAVYDGLKWDVDYTRFKSVGVLTIRQAPDKSIWIGGSGISIYK